VNSYSRREFVVNWDRRTIILYTGKTGNSYYNAILMQQGASGPLLPL